MTPFEATKRVLEEAGIRYTLLTRGKHHKFRFFIRGKKITLVCSRSSSDGRAGLNARLQARRVIREALDE